MHHRCILNLYGNYLMIRPTKSLPENYHAIGSIDLSKNLRALIWLNLIGLGLFVLTGSVFIQALYWLRPHEAGNGLTLNLSGAGSILELVVAFLALYAGMILLHEAIHGLFFWSFTGERPVFAIRWSYAYAAAPGWFLPRNLYFVIALSPLVGISLLGLAIFALAPPAWFMPTLVVVVANASGAIGDIWVALWLLRHPPTCLARDQGDAVTLYLP
jgi:hypothetical protein